MSCVDCFLFFSSRRRHTRCSRDWSSDVCSSDLATRALDPPGGVRLGGRRRAGGAVAVESLRGLARVVHLRVAPRLGRGARDRKSTRLNSSHGYNSYAALCLEKKNKQSKRILSLP